MGCAQELPGDQADWPRSCRKLQRRSKRTVTIGDQDVHQVRALIRYGEICSTVHIEISGSNRRWLIPRSRVAAQRRSAIRFERSVAIAQEIRDGVIRLIDDD